jgi:SPP1 gp7 family putative phage head morphogenesis protein
MAATKTRRPTITLPPIQDSRGATAEYTKVLRSLVREIAKQTRDEVVPAVVAEMNAQAERRKLTADAIEEDPWFQRLLDLALRLGLIAEEMASRIFRVEGKRHTEKWLQSVRSAIGIDIGAVIAQEDLEDVLRLAAKRNASLIRNLSQTTVQRVERAAYDAVANGTTVKQFTKQLTKEFGIADRRAQLIARDQIIKLTSTMNRVRHEQAGVTKYQWSSSHDEKVRGLHRAIDGDIYEYGKPTEAEDGLPPGMPPNCRCIARAYVVIGGEEFAPNPLPETASRFARPSEELTPEAMASARSKERQNQAFQRAGVGQRNKPGGRRR